MQLAPLVSKHAKGDDSTTMRGNTGNPGIASSSLLHGDGPPQKSVYGIATPSPHLNSLSVKPASLQGDVDFIVESYF